jgi:hypothetical protein
MDTLYTLAFLADNHPVVFYVGHTNDIERRRREHFKNPLNAEHPEYNTYKYRWCRDLLAADVEYTLTPIQEIETEDDSEYEWILKFARDNEQRGISFYDGYPLTNMKAGDFLEDLIKNTNVVTALQIRHWRAERRAKEIRYQEDLGDAEQSAVAIELIEMLKEQGHDLRVQGYKEEVKKLKKDIREREMLASPKRKELIKQQVVDLLKRELLEKTITWYEYDSEIKRMGGYPEYTETKPQLKY